MTAIHIPQNEVRFRTSRSGGPGGQNVNKLETRVELLFDVKSSTALTEEQKERVLEKLSSRLDEEGILRIVVQESRSQWQNKERAKERLRELLTHALKPTKKRVKTKPTVRAREQRLQAKKNRGDVKRLRKVDDAP